MIHPLHYCENRFCTDQELRIHPHDLGFMRAYGVFDFVPVYSGTPFRLQEHLKRLALSAKAVDIEMPYSPAEIEAIAFALLRAIGPLTGGLRFFVTAGPASAHTLVPVGQPQLLIVSEVAPPSPLVQVRVTTTRLKKTLPHVKTISYLPAVLGMSQARKRGCQDALFVDEQDYLIEGLTSNLFFIRRGVLHTDDSHRIIKGVTRTAVLEVARDLLPIEMRPISIREMGQCEEAFLTSSQKDLLPIVAIDGQLIGEGAPGSQTKKLRESFCALRAKELRLLRQHHSPCFKSRKRSSDGPT